MISILIIVAVTTLFFGIAIFAMSIGLILKKKPMHGGCGSKVDETGKFIPCDSCSEQEEAGKELHKALIDDDFRKTFGQFARNT
jgi:hypothetical protein